MANSLVFKPSERVLDTDLTRTIVRKAHELANEAGIRLPKRISHMPFFLKVSYASKDVRDLLIEAARCVGSELDHDQAKIRRPLVPIG